MKLTIEKLKADHKSIYDEVVASVTPDTSDLEASHAEVVGAKDTEIADLKKELNASQSNETDLTTRVNTLEKRDAIRDEESLKAKAEGIMSGALLASTLPERIHAKVGQVDYNKYVTDGKLDITAYTDAVNAEVKDWEDTVGEVSAPIQGVNAQVKPAAAAEEDADDEAVNRMLGHVQKKEA